MNLRHRNDVAPSRFPVRILFGYLESEVPPRCRNPRLVPKDDGEYTVRIPLLTDIDAPVALIATGKHLSNGEKWRVEYRWWNSRLWTSLNVSADSKPKGRHANADNWDWPDWTEQVDLRCIGFNQSYDHGFDRSPFGSKADAVRTIRNWVKDHVIIDGKPYRATLERGYHVTTFGLGGNHGGTGLFVDSVFDTREAKRKGMFNLLDRAKAIAYAEDVAIKRGDTENLPMEVHGDVEWEILVPEALRIARR